MILNKFVNMSVTIDFLYHKEKRSICNIAKLLNRNKSSISREIKRNTDKGYYSYRRAEEKSITRTKNKYMFRVEKHKEFNDLFLKYFDKRVHGVKATLLK